MAILWRDTGNNPRFGPLDARAVFPIFLWMLHMRWWTFCLAIFSVAVLVFLGKKGIPVNVALRQGLSLLRGKRRPVRESVDLRRRCRW